MQQQVVERHLSKKGKTIDEIMFPSQEVYKTGEGEYVQFSTDKPPRGTEYTVVTRENKVKGTDEYN